MAWVVWLRASSYLELCKEGAQMHEQGRLAIACLISLRKRPSFCARTQSFPALCFLVNKDGKEADEQFEEYVETIESLGTSTNEVRTKQNKSNGWRVVFPALYLSENRAADAVKQLSI